MSKTTAVKIAAIMRHKGFSLAFAESCTGGLAGHIITNVAGSSSFFKGSIVAYSNDIKIRLLKVPKNTLARYGAVSKDTALAMAVGARSALKADIGLSITGIAGPGGGSKNKPVGTVFIAISSKKRKISTKHSFKGTRLGIKTRSANIALKTLEKFLEKR